MPYLAIDTSLERNMRLQLFCCSMEYYLQKTYYKTASLISNSCKAIALLAGQTAEVSMLAYDYGKNLVHNTLLLQFLSVVYKKIKLNIWNC